MLTLSSEQVDLDKVVEDLTKWQKHTGEICRANACLQQKNEVLSQQVADLEEKKKLLDKEVATMRGIVDNLQGILSKRCDMEDENRQLVQQMTALHGTLQEAEEIHKKKMEQSEDQMLGLKQTHKLELAALQNKSKDDAEAQKNIMQQTLDKKNIEINCLQQQLSEMERDRQAEIIKLRLEYDKKLLKMQSTKAQQAAQASGPNQDIFRKKLQHVKAAAEREVAALKKTVTELQAKLSTLQQKAQAHTGPGPGAPKKMRRF